MVLRPRSSREALQVERLLGYRRGFAQAGAAQTAKRRSREPVAARPGSVW